RQQQRGQQQQQVLRRGIRVVSPADIYLEAPSDRRHYRNGITVFDRGGFFLQVADVFVIEVDIDESAQFAIVGVEVAAQVRMRGNEAGEGVGDGCTFHLNRGLLPGILP